MKIAPDLVWLVDGEVRACIDVKYKVEKHGQYPNADLYQMAAYYRRSGLGKGHLVYAAGEAEANPDGRRHRGPAARALSQPPHRDAG